MAILQLSNNLSLLIDFRGKLCLGESSLHSRVGHTTCAHVRVGFKLGFGIAVNPVVVLSNERRVIRMVHLWLLVHLRLLLILVFKAEAVLLDSARNQSSLRRLAPKGTFILGGGGLSTRLISLLLLTHVVPISIAVDLGV